MKSRFFRDEAVIRIHSSSMKTIEFEEKYQVISLIGNGRYGYDIVFNEGKFSKCASWLINAKFLLLNKLTCTKKSMEFNYFKKFPKTALRELQIIKTSKQ